jgi:hypothetical protein
MYHQEALPYCNSSYFTIRNSMMARAVAGNSGIIETRKKTPSTTKVHQERSGARRYL